jgi:hypothetical protein
MSREVLEPNEVELKWIEAQLKVARSAIKVFAPGQGEGITLRALDAAFAAWLAQHDAAKEDPNPYINAFGIAFGQHFVDQLGFTWAVVRDEDGTEMAVHGITGGGDSFVYPPNFVAKRYMSKATDFFERTFQEMRRDIEHPPSAPAKKPGWKFWSRDG